jgi:hypothetical protein
MYLTKKKKKKKEKKREKLLINDLTIDKTTFPREALADHWRSEQRKCRMLHWSTQGNDDKTDKGMQLGGWTSRNPGFTGGGPCFTRRGVNLSVTIESVPEHCLRQEKWCLLKTGISLLDHDHNGL